MDAIICVFSGLEDFHLPKEQSLDFLMPLLFGRKPEFLPEVLGSQLCLCLNPRETEDFWICPSYLNVNVEAKM